MQGSLTDKGDIYDGGPFLCNHLRRLIFCVKTRFTDRELRSLKFGPYDDLKVTFSHNYWNDHVPSSNDTKKVFV